MCLSVCSLFDFLNLLPLLLLLVLPLYGTFFGVQYASKLSIIFYLYIGLQSFLPPLLTPLAGGAILLSLAGIPANLIPAFLISSYNFVLLITNPLLITIEIKQIVHKSRNVTKWMADFIDENEITGKTLILSSSILCYGTSFLIAGSLFSSDLDYMKWLVCVVMTLQGVVVCVTIYKDSGIISDAGFSCLFSTLSLCLLKYESEVVMSSLTSRSGYFAKYSDIQGNSFFELLLKIPELGSDFVHGRIEILKVFFSFSFWMLVGLRIICACMEIGFGNKNEDEDFETSDDDESQNLSWILNKLKFSEVRHKLGRNLALQMVATFVYSQLVTRQMYLNDSDVKSLIGFVTCTLWIFERIGQSFGFALYHLWLLKYEDEQDTDW